jgi:hypothetical protein
MVMGMSEKLKGETLLEITLTNLTKGNLVRQFYRNVHVDTSIIKYEPIPEFGSASRIP